MKPFFHKPKQRNNQFDAANLEKTSEIACCMKKLILFFLLFCQLQTFGQDYAVRHFSVADGMPSGTVINLYQDSRGFLWLSTLAGLSRFDGKHFVNYSLEEGLPYSFADDICEDPNGDLFVSHNIGLSRFNGTSFTDLKLNKAVNKYTIRDLICEEDGSVLAVEREQLISIVGDSLIHHPNPEKRQFYCATKRADGSILIGGSGGIYIWKNKCLSLLIEEKGERVQSMEIGPDSCLWYGLLHNKLKRFPLNVKGAKAVSVNIPELGSGFIAAFLASDSNYVYVGTQHGFLVFDDGRFVKHVKGFMKVPSDMVNGLKTDNEGNIWVASLFGLWRFSHAFAYVYPADSILAKNIYSIRVSGSDSVVFTDGFYNYTAGNGGIKEIFRDKPTQGSEVHDILHTPEGYTYFASNLSGITIRDPKGKYENLTLGPGPFYRCTVLAYHRGSVYMGSHQGYYILNGKEYKGVFPETFVGHNVLSIWVDDEHILLGTNSSLYQQKKDGSMVNYTSFFDSMPIVIEDIYRDKDRFLVSTKGKGLYILKIKDGLLEKDTVLTRKNGLPSNYLTSAITDNSGQIWISTLQGLSKVRLEDNALYVRNYSRNQGIPDAFWEHCRFRKDPLTGTLWIGNSEGLLRIHPEVESQHVRPPLIHLESVHLHQEKTSLHSAIIHPTQDSLYEVPFGQNNLQFHLAAVLLSGAEDIEYWYKIQGGKDEWILAPANGVIDLNNLSPGTYRLLFTAFDRANKAYSEEKAFNVRIARPFWMSGWFYFLMLLMFIGLIYAYFKYRVSRALKKQNAAINLTRQISESKYLAFQARMNPHFIFNSLNAIQYFITQNDKKSSLTYLSKFARLLRQVLDLTKAIKVPLQEEVEMLKSYLEMESMRFDGHFNYEITLEDPLAASTIEIPGMLLQPFVENAIVHGLLHLQSGEGMLRIHMKKEDDFIICTVSDNGVGRKKSAAINAQRKPNHKSHGMEIASNRLQLLVENSRIEDLIQMSDPSEGTGTIVNIKLPIL